MGTRNYVRTVGLALATILALAAVAAFADLDSLVVAAIILAGLWVLGFYLWWTSADRDKSWGDLGRGVMIGVIMAFAIGAVQHRIDDRINSREKRQTFELSISTQKDLSGINLSGRDLHKFYLSRKNFQNAILHGTNLQGAYLQRADLSGADLTKANLRGANLHDAILERANLDGADLHGADLTSAHMSGARLPDADLTKAKLDGADLTEACMAPADLSSASMAGTDLTRAVLTSAILNGAVMQFDLRNAKIAETGLAGVKSDDRTVWPDGFNPATRKRLTAGIPVGDGPANVPIPNTAKADRVAKVVDGDTLLTQDLGPIRLIGVDAPKPEDPLNKSATAFAAKTLRPGDVVRYAFDPGTPAVAAAGIAAKPGQKQDKFGRNLVYMWLADNRMFNQLLLEQGLAERLESAPNLYFAAQLRSSETAAKRAGAPIWRACPAR